jgi:hypothetical protein
MGLSTGSSDILQGRVAHAAVTALYVATNGSDTNPGTPAQPLKSITRSSVLATPGTIVHVAPGTYDGVIRTNASGTADARIVYISDTKWGAQIRNSSGIKQNSLWYNTGSYLDIVGFDIGSTPACSSQQGIGDSGHHIRVFNNRIHDIDPCSLGGAGINFGSDSPNGTNYLSSDNEAFGNLIDNMGSYNLNPTPTNPAFGLAHGIYAPEARLKVYNNIISRVVGWGIQLNHYATNDVVANNIVMLAADGGIINGSRDAGCSKLLPNGNAGSVINNNILFRNRVGIAAQNDKDPVTGQMCTVTGASYADNLFFGSTVANFGSPLGYPVEAIPVRTIVADPQFVNYTGNALTGDYRLKSTSPAIDSGTLASAPSVDVLGAPRPQGGGVDVGAFEYAPATPPSPTPQPTPSATPTATPSAGGSMTLGNSTPGKSFDSGESNHLNGYRFLQGALGGHVRSISVFVGPVDAAPSNQYQVAMYSDNNRAPGGLIAISNVGTLRANAWNTLAISASVQPNTAYWLVYNSNGTRDSVNNLAIAPSSSGSAMAIAAHFTTWPQTVGAVAEYPFVGSIYATVSP